MRPPARLLLAAAIALAAALALPAEALAAPLESAGLPPDWPQRAARLLAQALGGTGAAIVLVAATFWLARRRVRH